MFISPSIATVCSPVPSDRAGGDLIASVNLIRNAQPEVFYRLLIFSVYLIISNAKQLLAYTNNWNLKKFINHYAPI